MLKLRHTSKPAVPAEAKSEGREDDEYKKRTIMDSTHNNYLRFFTVIIVFFLLYGMIILNLYFIQIQQTSFFKDLGDKQYNITLQTLPQRAYIYDRNNNP